MISRSSSSVHLGSVALGILVGVACVNASEADVIYTAGDTLDIPFLPGQGISNTDFYTAQDSVSGITLALRGRQRWYNNVSYDGSTYFVQSGYSGVAQGSETLSPYAWWNFDVAVYGGGVGISNSIITFSVDFDPALGSSTATTATIPLNYVPGVPALGPYFASENMGFEYWATQFGQSFDPNALGNYTISLSVFVTSGQYAGTTFGSQVNVQVIPAPAALALAGGVGMIGRRRRR